MNVKERANNILVKDRVLVLFQESGVKWPEKFAGFVTKNLDIAFENCETYDDMMFRVQELNQLQISHFIRSLLKKANVSVTEEEIQSLVDDDIFCNCKNPREATRLLQEILLTRETASLLKEAGIKWPSECIKNLAMDYEKVFNGCETREDAIEKLRELSKVVEL